MRKAITASGLPGSCKSTTTEQLSRKQDEHLTLDSIESIATLIDKALRYVKADE